MNPLFKTLSQKEWTGVQFSLWLEATGLRPGAAGRAIGITRPTMNKYRTGGAAQRIPKTTVLACKAILLMQKEAGA